ncbi:MAG TPA: hypothetical protein VGP36_14165 [Mycobacteriales bacterium]|nr:hypothetical protein [Mycobacteriales bacterium]
MPTAIESVHLVAATIGFVSFGALWAGTLMGTVLRSGWASARLRHHTVHGIHMHLILLGLCLGVVHGLVQLAAPGGRVRGIDVVIPFTDRADPLGVGLGVLALELMIATALSVLVQRKLGWQRWRALHSLGYLSFTMVAAHLMISGSEVAAAPVRAAVALAWGTVVLAGAATIAPVARLPRSLLERVARQQRAEEITVAVDAVRCKSFGFCEQEAPAIFSLRSDRRLAYRSVVSSDQADVAMRAAVVCPARAIAIGRLPTSVVLAQTGEQELVPAEAAPVAESLAPAFRPAAVPRRSPEPVPRRAAADPVRRAAEPVAHRTPAAEPVALRSSTPTPSPEPEPAPRRAAPVPVARLAPVADPGTGPLPRVAAGPGTGSLPRVASGPGTGSLPRVASGPGTGSLPRVASGPGTGSLPRVAGGPGTGSLPPIATGPGSLPRTANDSGNGSLPRVSGDPGTGSLPRVSGPGTGSLPRVSGDPGTGSLPRVGAPPGPRAVGAPRPGARAARPAEALPPPSDMQDTGRHHLPPLRGIPGGRSGAGR